LTDAARFNPRDLWLLVIAILLFGGAWPITKDALRDATPLWFAVSRAGLATLSSGLVLLMLGRLRWPGRRDWLTVLVLGVLQLGLFFALSHLALAVLPAGRIAVLANVVSYWLVPLSVVLLGEKVSSRRWVASGLSLAGALVLMQPWTFDWSQPAVIMANGLLVTAALLWSLAIIYARRRPPTRAMAELLPFLFAVALLVLLPLAFLREPSGGIGTGSWIHALFIGAVAAPIGTWSVIEAGRRLPSAVASVGFMLVPVLGVAAGALWLGEALGWDVWLGGGLIAASILLALRG
jgi:drug/metabolite transporter (DMT)-like permease